MKIIVVHSSSYDFRKELYEPIMNSPLYADHEITLPHLTDAFMKSKSIIENCDLVLAEVSHPSTGQGIELGWADTYGKTIYCFSKKDSKPSGALKVVTDKFVEYENSEDMVIKLTEIINQHK